MKYVLFDIDSTLIEAHSQSNKGASRVMFKKVFGIDANEEMVPFRGMTENHLIRSVTEKITGKKLDKIPQKAYDIWADTAKAALKKSPAKTMPGIGKLLQDLTKQKGISLAVVTGNSPKRALYKLQSAKMVKYFTNKKGEVEGSFGSNADNREELILNAKKKYLKKLTIK
ncbi:MAG TPA: HAD hydrolase-like protein [Candidatus Saccharimonadales bacterium]|nr:HAD hydrolase-like protein [Candidatus Saccharimonadales bacterium]